MAKYIFKRILQSFFIILLIACVTFFIMNLVPGGPFLNEKTLSPDLYAAKQAKYGLDQPILIQLKNYLADLLHLDFGVSFRMQMNRPVLTIIMEMFPVSARIGAIALVFAIIAGVPIGCVCAYYRGTIIDSILRVVTTIGISVPGFVIATLLLNIFGVKLNLLPTIGLMSWKSFIMPCFTLAFSPMCYISRLSRTSMLDVLGQDYIRTARAKGLSTKKVIFKHALKNALVPVLTYLGPLTANILTGGFVVETVFSIPGLGRYFVQSISNRDYPIIMGTTIFLAAFVVFMSLAVDILYKAVDPRIDIL